MGPQKLETIIGHKYSIFKPSKKIIKVQTVEVWLTEKDVAHLALFMKTLTINKIEMIKLE